MGKQKCAKFVFARCKMCLSTLSFADYKTPASAVVQENAVTLLYCEASKMIC